MERCQCARARLNNRICWVVFPINPQLGGIRKARLVLNASETRKQAILYPENSVLEAPVRPNDLSRRVLAFPCGSSAVEVALDSDSPTASFAVELTEPCNVPVLAPAPHTLPDFDGDDDFYQTPFLAGVPRRPVDAADRNIPASLRPGDEVVPLAGCAVPVSVFLKAFASPRSATDPLFFVSLRAVLHNENARDAVDVPLTRATRFVTFTTKYAELSKDAFLTLEFSDQRHTAEPLGDSATTASVRVALFDADGFLRTGDVEAPFLVRGRSHVSIIDSDPVTRYENNGTVRIQVNDVAGVCDPRGVETTMWRVCGDFHHPVDGDAIIARCRRLSVLSEMPGDLQERLFLSRHFFALNHFEAVGFWVFKATILFDGAWHTAFLDEMLEFVEREGLVAQTLPFPRVLPYFAAQTNNRDLRMRVGVPLFERVPISEMVEFVPCVIEILRTERADGRLFRNLCTRLREHEDRALASRFVELVCWDIANEVYKMKDFFVFQPILEGLRALVVFFDAHSTVFHDISEANSLFAQIEKYKVYDRDKKTEAAADQLKELMKKDFDFSLPFLQGRRIKKIIETMVLSSATKPFRMEVQLDGSGDKLKFMAKTGDDLMKDKLVLILSSYICKKLRGAIDMKYSTYTIVEMGKCKGYVEFVPDVKDLSSITGEQFLKTFKSTNKEGGEGGPSNGGVDEAKQHQLNFAKSYALCCVLNYALILRDRHMDNYMFNTKTGSINHIDFGFIFGEMVTGKPYEQEITRFKELIYQLHTLNLYESFLYYARWAWEKVVENSQDIANMCVFLCYNSVEQEKLKAVTERLLEGDTEKFMYQMETSVLASELMQCQHDIAMILKKAVNFFT